MTTCKTCGEEYFMVHRCEGKPAECCHCIHWQNDIAPCCHCGLTVEVIPERVCM